MKPEDPLVIYEIKSQTCQAVDELADEIEKSGVGPHFLGFHQDGDNAFIFCAAHCDERVNQLLNKNPGALSLNVAHDMTYGQWQDGAGAEPFTVGRLSVIPPGGEAPEPFIIIDPGLAFGFGGHPTTKSCLEFVQNIYAHTPADQVLDLGTGTGILAIAAAKMGAKHIIGLDFSHLAADAAKENVRLNRVEDQVTIIRGRAQDWLEEKADLVMANLHLSLQLEMCDLGAFNKCRHLIVSGLLTGEEDQLTRRLEQCRLKLLDLRRTDRWVSMHWGRQI